MSKTEVNCQMKIEYLEDYTDDQLKEYIMKERPQLYKSLKETRSVISSDIRRRNSLTGELYEQMLQVKANKDFKLEQKDLGKLSESDLMRELIRDITQELDMDIVCFKILFNINLLTQSDRSSLFLARGSKESRYLVSKFFDVTVNSSMSECLHTEEQLITVPFGQGIAGIVAQTKEAINISVYYSLFCLLLK